MNSSYDDFEYKVLICDLDECISSLIYKAEGDDEIEGCLNGEDIYWSGKDRWIYLRDEDAKDIFCELLEDLGVEYEVDEVFE